MLALRDGDTHKPIHTAVHTPMYTPIHTHTADLAKLSAISGVPGVKESKLLKNALHGNKGAADMSIYGTRTPQGIKTIFSGDKRNRLGLKV
jgi:hypothetical protein